MPTEAQQNIPGLPARHAAAKLLHAVLYQNRPLDQMLDAGTGLPN